MTLLDSVIKRVFDVCFSVIGLLLFGWLILIANIAASIDTRKSGFFRQERVGKNGAIFKVIKIRTMREVVAYNTVVTTSDDPRITRLGRLFRKTKIDELPQLVNVLLGHMSFVGPRPDVPGFADQIVGPDKIILSIRPGITGPATLKYRNEEKLLAEQKDPEQYNRDVIFPDKVRINREYVEKYSIFKDIDYIIKTVIG